MKEIEETNNCIKRSANLFQREKNIGTRLDRYTTYYSIMQIEIFINTISEIGIKVEMYSFFSCNGSENLISSKRIFLTVFFFDKKSGISRNLSHWKSVLIKIIEDFKFYNNICFELILRYFSFAFRSLMNIL